MDEGCSNVSRRKLGIEWVVLSRSHPCSSTLDLVPIAAVKTIGFVVPSHSMSLLYVGGVCLPLTCVVSVPPSHLCC